MIATSATPSTFATVWSCSCLPGFRQTSGTQRTLYRYGVELVKLAGHHAGVSHKGIGVDQMAGLLVLWRRFRLLLAERRAMALLRGYWYRLYYRLHGVDLTVGPKFHVFGRLRIKGGARVVIGRLVFVGGELIIEGSGTLVIGDQVEIVEGLRVIGPGSVFLGERSNIRSGSVLETQNSHSRITIGDRTMLRGVEFNCVREIVIGHDCMIAPAMVMDSDFHSTRADRHSLDSPVRIAPVHVSDNVWVAERAALLPGTSVGKNSVVSFGAICMREYPEDVIIAGYPARVSAPLPSPNDDGPPEELILTPGTCYVPLRELRHRLVPW